MSLVLRKWDAWGEGFGADAARFRRSRAPRQEWPGAGAVVSSPRCKLSRQAPSRRRRDASAKDLYSAHAQCDRAIGGHGGVPPGGADQRVFFTFLSFLSPQRTRES